jgi:exo-beta-1,3-glucanase (GH17 family)
MLLREGVVPISVNTTRLALWVEEVGWACPIVGDRAGQSEQADEKGKEAPSGCECSNSSRLYVVYVEITLPGHLHAFDTAWQHDAGQRAGQTRH